MKKHLLCLTAGSLLFAAASIAQPTLTATGINPVLGDNYTLDNGGYVSPGSAGASQTWNLSSMSGTSAGVTTVVTPASTTYGASFTSATVAANNTSASVCTYYKTTAAALQNYGISSGTTPIAYSNPEDFLRFPVAFNNTFTDPWAAQFTSGAYTFYRRGSTTVTADSYGTLITPNGTYSNVMRIHFVQTYQDSAFIGTPYIITYSNDEYMWYKNGAHVQIASVYTLTSSAASPFSGGSYVTGSVDVNDISNVISEYSLSPNPATDKIKLDFTLTENKNVQVRLYNEVGQKMEIDQAQSGIQGMNSMQLDVAALPEGIYFAQIVLEGNIAATKRFIIAK